MFVSVLFGCLVGCQTQTNSIFVAEMIGSGPYRAFSQPEKVTIQSVYPANRGEKVEKQFGVIKLRFVSKPHAIKPQHVQALIENFSHPYRPLEQNCVFHPDHHIVFRNGTDVLEAITCFTCDEIMVMANGRYIDRVSMGPPKKLRTIFTSSVPLSDTLRASSEEWLSRECVNAFAEATGGMVSKASYKGDKLPALSAQIRSIGASQLSKSEIQNLFNILEVHCFNNRLTFRFAQPKLANLTPPAAFVQLNTKSRVSLVFYAAYSRAQLYVGGKASRVIDLFGIEDRLQAFLMPRLSSK
jgi:hypothetical protein